MEKTKKQKFKDFLLKCLFDNDTNNFIVSVLYIPFLIIGLTTDLKWLLLYGGLGVVLLNKIIQKVVRKRIDLTQYNFNTKKKLKKKGDK